MKDERKNLQYFVDIALCMLLVLLYRVTFGSWFAVLLREIQEPPKEFQQIA